MYVTCSTLPFRKKPLSEALQELSDLGVKRVEFCGDSHHSDQLKWEFAPEVILDLIKSTGISVTSLHVPFLEISPRTSLDDLREMSTKITCRTIDLASFFGADFIVQHLCLLKDSLDLQQNGIIAKTAPALPEVIQYAADRSIRIAIENAPTTSIRMWGANTTELTDLANALPSPNSGICLDITHCIACGLDPLKAMELIDSQRLISIHASDNYKNQMVDQHLPIGAGDLPWRSIFHKLESQEYQGYFVIEIAGNSDGTKFLVDSFNYLRKLNVTVSG